MKKFLVSLVIATIVSISARAQDTSVAVTDSVVPKTQHELNPRDQMTDGYRRLPPERKPKMDKHHEMMEKLSPQQKEEVKKEMDRHRAEMKRITGFEHEMPPMHQ